MNIHSFPFTLWLFSLPRGPSIYFLYKEIYFANPATNALGLEKCMEAIIDLLDTGLAKIIHDEENDCLYIGHFNSMTGNYEAPFYQGNCE